MFCKIPVYTVADSLNPEVKRSGFELDIIAIKNYLVDIANTY